MFSGSDMPPLCSSSSSSTTSLDFTGTPAWLLPWGKRHGPPHEEQAAAAEVLMRRIRQHAARLDIVDAWVDVRTRELAYSPPPVLQRGRWTPLRIGDTVHYSQVMRLAFVTHDMTYVGHGCVVGLARHSERYSQECAITLERLDVLQVRGKCITVDPHGGRSRLSRAAVAARALLSLGQYTYSATRFNCQHAYERILGGGWFSEGFVRLVALGTLCVAGAAVAIGIGAHFGFKRPAGAAAGAGTTKVSTEAAPAAVTATTVTVTGGAASTSP